MSKSIYKKQKYSEKKVLKNNLLTGQRFLNSLLILVVISISVFTVFNFSIENLYSWLTVTGTSTGLASFAFIANIDEAGNNEKSGGILKNEIYILRTKDEADMNRFPILDSNGLRPDIPLKNGKYWHYIGILKNYDIKSDTEDYTLKNVLKVNVAGLAKDTVRFLRENNKGLFIVGLKFCNSNEKLTVGSACGGAELTLSMQLNEKTTGAELTFTTTCPDSICYYLGNFPIKPAYNLAVDTTSIALDANETLYQLASGSTDSVIITGFTAVPAHDFIFTLLGSGGAHPSIINSSSSIFLKDGITWNANANSQITFKAFKTGASSYIFIEIARA